MRDRSIEAPTFSCGLCRTSPFVRGTASPYPAPRGRSRTPLPPAPCFDVWLRGGIVFFTLELYSCGYLMMLFTATPCLVGWFEGWVDFGNHTCDRYLPAASAALFFLSLVGGFSAPLITQVLSCTGYMTTKGPLQLWKIANRAVNIRSFLLWRLGGVDECLIGGSANLPGKFP
jgi:hypothetical protein